MLLPFWIQKAWRFRCISWCSRNCTGHTGQRHECTDVLVRLRARRMLLNFINSPLNWRVVLVWLVSGLKWKMASPHSVLDPLSWVLHLHHHAAQCCWRRRSSLFHFKWACRAALCCFITSCPLSGTFCSQTSSFPKDNKPPPSDSGEDLVYVTAKAKTMVFNSK